MKADGKILWGEDKKGDLDIRNVPPYFADAVKKWLEDNA